AGDDRGTDRDGEVGVPGEVEVTHHAAVDPSSRGLQRIDELDRARLGGTGEGPGREGGDEALQCRRARAELADDRGDEVHDVAVAMDGLEVDHFDGLRPADLGEVVAGQVDEHDVLGHLFGVGQQIV